MADAWTNDATDYGNDKNRRDGGGFKRVLITLLEPHCFLPIVLFFLIGGVIVFRGEADVSAVHHATAAGLNVMSADEARLARMHESPKKVVHVHKESKHVNDAYPCDDYDDCKSCTKGGCGWCLGQGWCVEDVPGICNGFEDHIGRATGKECPANAKTAAEIEKELAERLSAKLGGG